jgi:hypothetical protein
VWHHCAAGQEQQQQQQQQLLAGLSVASSVAWAELVRPGTAYVHEQLCKMMHVRGGVFTCVHTACDDFNW